MSAGDGAGAGGNADRAPVSSVSCQVYRVPTDQPEADGTLEWSATTVVVVEVAAGGLVGLGWTYASAGCQAVVVEELSEAVVGTNALDVPRAHEAMVRACRNLGRPGLVAQCHLRCRHRPVGPARRASWGSLWPTSSVVAGTTCPSTAAAASPPMTTQTSAAQLEHWVDELGYPAGQDQDRRVVGNGRGTRPGSGGSLPVVSSATTSSSTSTPTAVTRPSRRCASVAGWRTLGVIWFEEPVSSDDLAGLRQVREQVGLDVAAGEYGYDETYFDRMVAAEAVDCVQVDVTRCGGYTLWLRIAAIAAAHGLQVSGHCAPQLHGQWPRAVPNLRHVEYFHDHSRLDALLFDGVSPPSGRFVSAPAVDRMGHGMALRRPMRRRFRSPEMTGGS